MMKENIQRGAHRLIGCAGLMAVMAVALAVVAVAVKILYVVASTPWFGR